MFRKKRYLAVFLKKVQNSYHIVGKKLFNPSADSIKFQNQAYTLNFEISTCSRGNTDLYYINIDTKNQLTFQKGVKSNKIDTTVLDMIISKKIIKQLTSDLGNTDYKMIMIYFTIGAIIGGLIGWIAKGAI